MTQMTDPCVKNFRKIFVGGLTNNTGKRKQARVLYSVLGLLMTYFEQFGPVEDCIIMIDRDNSNQLVNNL